MTDYYTSNTMPLQDESQSNLQAARLYVALVANPASTFEDIRTMLADDILWREMPNRFAPSGRTHTLAGMEESWQRGREVVADQVYDIRQAVASGDAVALEIGWHGTVLKDLGLFVAGTTLRADLGMFLQFAAGKIISQTDYPCYYPIE